MSRIMSPREVAKRLTIDRAYARAIKNASLMDCADTMATAWESVAGMPMLTPADWHGMPDTTLET